MSAQARIEPTSPLALLGAALVLLVPALVVAAALALGERGLATGLAVAFAASLASLVRDVRRAAFSPLTGVLAAAAALLVCLLGLHAL